MVWFCDMHMVGGARGMHTPAMKAAHITLVCRHRTAATENAAERAACLRRVLCMKSHSSW